MVIFTLMPVTVALAGIPLTAIVCAAPAWLLSGIATAIVPELKATVVVVEEELFSLTAGSPKHIVTELGTTVGAGGV
jgi:hypothetical protein